MGPGEPSRYETILKLASGGMATVWVGTVRGALGFRQLVAIKKPHPHLLAAPTFRSELVAEARLASLIHHANVVDVRDVELDGESISLVMDYIEGASFAELVATAAAAGERLPPRVVVRVVLDALAGLHAAHELLDEDGRVLELIHRDVSPHNILVGADGIARVTDFGVAKFAHERTVQTTAGSLKGKIAYMAPEYVRGAPIDRRVDVFAMGVVLWEALTGKRCFRGETEAETVHRLLHVTPELPSREVSELGDALDAVVSCAIDKSRDERFSNAAAMAKALETSALDAKLLGGHTEVSAIVKELCGADLEERRQKLRATLAQERAAARASRPAADEEAPAANSPSAPPRGAEEEEERTDEDAPAATEAKARRRALAKTLVGAPKPRRGFARTLVMPDAPAPKPSREATPRTVLRSVPPAPPSAPPPPPSVPPPANAMTAAGSAPPPPRSSAPRASSAPSPPSPPPPRPSSPSPRPSSPDTTPAGRAVSAESARMSRGERIRRASLWSVIGVGSIAIVVSGAVLLRARPTPTTATPEASARAAATPSSSAGARRPPPSAHVETSAHLESPSAPAASTPIAPSAPIPVAPTPDTAKPDAPASPPPRSPAPASPAPASPAPASRAHGSTRSTSSDATKTSADTTKASADATNGSTAGSAGTAPAATAATSDPFRELPPVKRREQPALDRPYDAP